jgi:hypothetical protein
MADPDIFITPFGKNDGSLMIPICSGNDECCEPAVPEAMRMLWKNTSSVLL